MVQDELNSLRGRVQALEIVATALLTAHIAEGAQRPLTAVDAVERELLASLQLVERTVDPDSDAAWDAVAETLRRLFFNVRQKLQAAAR